MLSSNTSAANGAATYIENVFSTYLWDGTGATLSIVNNIDLATKGGLTWIKQRGQASAHALFDTARGATNRLATNGTNAQATVSGVTAFNTNGFTSGTDAETNGVGNTYVGWTFRKQPKFFDVVTYTGTGSARTVAHNLGSLPGCIMVKRTDTTGDWQVYHRSIANTEYMVLNSTAAKATGTNRWNSTDPTSTVFTVGTDVTVNASGGTYVAYIYAHDSGGFGLSGSENVISCGNVQLVSGEGSVNLGWEPQWLLLKPANALVGWSLVDNMRGLGTDVTLARQLLANTSAAEVSNNGNPYVSIGATGIARISAGTSDNYIYIAIRRGPMKVPTDATKVYNAIARTGTGAAATITGVGFPPDLVSVKRRDASAGMSWQDRLRGITKGLTPAQVSAEDPAVGSFTDLTMDGIVVGTGANSNVSAATYINHFFQRAPSFFDEVCYTGTGTTTQFVTHNLGVYPELVIQKRRNSTSDWFTSRFTNGSSSVRLLLNTTGGSGAANACNYTTETGLGCFDSTVGNISGATYVAYLFATCAGVSKVGSYTGTGTTKQVDCGFAAGARFVLIKRTDSTGDWYVWDTARGIVAGNDPYLLLNSTVAEVTTTDYIDTYSAGFELSSTAPAALNASGGTYIFLAIA